MRAGKVESSEMWSWLALSLFFVLFVSPWTPMCCGCVSVTAVPLPQLYIRASACYFAGAGMFLELPVVGLIGGSSGRMPFLLRISPLSAAACFFVRSATSSWLLQCCITCKEAVGFRRQTPPKTTTTSSNFEKERGDKHSIQHSCLRPALLLPLSLNLAPQVHVPLLDEAHTKQAFFKVQLVCKAWRLRTSTTFL